MADSKDLYDHDDVIQKQFENDWRRSLRLGIIKLIMQHDDDAAADDDGDGVPDEVEDVCEVFWRYRRVWPCLFNLYACYGTNIDLTALSLNQWTQLFVEGGFISKQKGSKCTMNDADRLFSEVNAKTNALVRDVHYNNTGPNQKKKSLRAHPAASTPAPAEAAHESPGGLNREARLSEESPDTRGKAKQISMKAVVGGPGRGLFRAQTLQRIALTATQPQDGSKSIDRVEFLFALVKVAILKYIISGAMVDVSDALERLLSVELRAKLGPSLTPPDDYRQSVCYTEAVTDVLYKYKPSLQAVFQGLSSASGQTGSLLSMNAWLGLMRALGWIGPDLTLREAVLSFSWSRMLVVDGQKVRGHLKETHLPLEGFFEALTRVAVLKALPTQAEIDSAGVDDCADFFLEVLEPYPDVYEQFRKVGTNRAEWGLRDIPGGDPIEVRVEFLCRLLIEKIEQQIGRTPEERDGNLTEYELKKWLKEVEGSFKGK